MLKKARSLLPPRFRVWITPDRLITIGACVIAGGAIASPSIAFRSDCNEPAQPQQASAQPYRPLNNWQRQNQREFEARTGRNYFDARESLVRRERERQLGKVAGVYRAYEQTKYGTHPDGYEEYQTSIADRIRRKAQSPTPATQPPTQTPDMPFSQPRTIAPPPGVKIPEYTGGSGSGSAGMSAADRIRRRMNQR